MCQNKVLKKTKKSKDGLLSKDKINDTLTKGQKSDKKINKI
jgi:hypothetical protein